MVLAVVCMCVTNMWTVDMWIENALSLTASGTSRAGPTCRNGCTANGTKVHSCSLCTLYFLNNARLRGPIFIPRRLLLPSCSHF